MITMKVECQTCSYEWDTSSKLKMVTCPSCGRKTPREKDITFDKKNSDEISGSKEAVSLQPIALFFLIGFLAIASIILVDGQTFEETRVLDGEISTTSMHIETNHVRAYKNGNPITEPEIQQNNPEME